MKWLKWEGRGEYAWSHLNLLCSRAVPNREFLFVCEPPLTFKSLSHPLCSGCRMIRLRAERWRRRWEEAGIKAIVWRGWIVDCGGGGSQGKVSTRFLNSALLNTWHLARQLCPGIWGVPHQDIFRMEIYPFSFSLNTERNINWGHLYDLHVLVGDFLDMQFTALLLYSPKAFIWGPNSMDFSLSAISCRETEETHESIRILQFVDPDQTG